MAARSLHWATQVKAMLLLAMLAGHEAARVQEQVRLAGALAGQGRGTVAEQGPEDDWQAENGVCKWETMSGGCVGPEFHGASTCKYRRLPLDWPPPSDQSCRLTDEYMLEKDRSRYFKLQSELLAAKAKKFEQCKGLKIYQLSGAMHCKRRAKHMLRALEFMSKAQDANLVNSLSEEEKASERALFDSALGSLSESIGPDGALVMELQAKMKKSSAMRKDPSRTAAKIVGLLQKLLKGTEAEQQEARDEINNMRDEDTDDDERADDESNHQHHHHHHQHHHHHHHHKHHHKHHHHGDDESDVVKKLEVNPEELNSIIDEVNVFENDDDSEDDTTNKQSMLQQAANTSEFRGEVTTASKTVSTIAFILIATLVVCAVVWVVVEVIAAIVAWALLAVLGCGFYTVGFNRGAAKLNNFERQKGALSTMKCITKVFTYPFALIGRAVVGVANLFRKPKKDNALLQLAGAVNASIES